MSEPAEQLQSTLDQLHEQLATVGVELDQATQDRLREIAAEIEQTLGQPQEENVSQPQESVVQRLQEAEIQFEQSHPTLAGTVRRLVDVLAQMGI